MSIKSELDRLDVGNSVVDEIIQEINNCKDSEKLKSLTDKLKDALVSKGPSFTKKLVAKWSKKLEILVNNPDEFNETDVKIVAILLENQYKYLKTHVDLENHFESEKIKLLTEQANQLTGEAREILLKTAEEKKKKLQKNPEDCFFFRGVNLFDEVVKFYDSLRMRKMVGIQPMAGPVGLSYSLRFIKNPISPKKKITQEEVIKMHNKLAEHEPLKVTSVKCYSELLPHVKKQYEIDYCIEGINDNSNNTFSGFSSVDETSMPEICLTMEQKEVLANVLDITNKEGKLNGYDVAKEVDIDILNAIKSVCNSPTLVSTEKLWETLNKSKYDISNRTKIGSANCIVSNGKYITKEIENQFEHNIIISEMEDGEIIIGYCGDNESKSGIVYSPYVVFLMKKSGKEYDKVSTRHGLVTEIIDTKLYYEWFIVKDK